MQTPYITNEKHVTTKYITGQTIKLQKNMPTWQQTETIKDNNAALTVTHTLVHLHHSLNISTNNTSKEERFRNFPRLDEG